MIKLYTLLILSLFVSPVLAAPPWDKSPKPGPERSHNPNASFVNSPPWEVDRNDQYVSKRVGINSGLCNRKTLRGILGGTDDVGKRRSKDVRFETFTGAVVGKLVGQRIGAKMDRVDQQCMGQALERASDNQWVRWQNPDTGLRYKIAPYATYQRADGRFCRKFRIEADQDGSRNRSAESACRTATGGWERS